MKLDLGSGPRPRAGYVGVDIVPAPGVIQADLFQSPWKVLNYGECKAQLTTCDEENFHLGTSSIDELHSSHLVEHVPDLVAFMHEAYRVLKPGGRFTIAHPYQHSDRAWQDPTHVRAINKVSWSYYDATWRRSIGIDHYDGFTCDFEVVQVKEILAPGIEKTFNMNRRKLDEAKRHWVNVIDDLVVTLRSRKSE